MTEVKLKLLQLDLDRWYSVFDSKGNNLTEVIKDLINRGWNFEFNEAYSLFKRHQSEDTHWMNINIPPDKLMFS